jgi:citrate lyase subunit beta/citryl-CoA lyase
MTANDPRSLLFVPVDQEKRITKAGSLAADVVILDLEDGVSPTKKDSARANLGKANRLLVEAGKTVWLRINSLHLGGHDDLQFAMNAGIGTIVVPKVRTPEDIREISALIAPGSLKYVALVEDALGILNAPTIAQVSGVIALAFGSEDFAATTSTASNFTALCLPAQMVVLAACAADLPAFGLAGSIAEYRDLEAFTSTVRSSKDLGFAGALCIHPAQVEIANSVFATSDARVAEAMAIIAAAQAAGGSPVGFAGRMIDAPIVARAERDLARSSR